MAVLPELVLGATTKQKMALIEYLQETNLRHCSLTPLLPSTTRVKLLSARVLLIKRGITELSSLNAVYPGYPSNPF